MTTYTKPESEKEEKEQLCAWLAEFDNDIDEFDPNDLSLSEARKIVNREYCGGLAQFWLDGGY